VRGASIRAAVAEDAPSTSEQDVDEFWRRFVVAMAKVADDTKCEDIIAYDVQSLVNWTSYMIICSVFSRPQLLAVLAKMEKVAEEEFVIIKQNSLGTSPWEVLDFGPVVVHVFTAEQREYYDLESFYGTAEEIELSLGQGASSASGAGPKEWTTKA
jgi:ribosome-associated protein